MDKGSLKKIFTTQTTHRIPKVATLAVTTCMLVAMVAIDASASPSSALPSLTRSTADVSVASSEASVSQLFGIEHHHLPVTSTSTTTTTAAVSTKSSSGGGGSTSSSGGGGGSAGAAPTTTTTAGRASVGTTTTTSLAPTNSVAPPTTTTTVAPPTTTTTAASTTDTSSSLQPAGDVAGSWNLIFDSEFTGTSLNTSQWSTGWFGSGITKGANSAETECMDPSQVSVGGGQLTLTDIAQSETCAGVTQPNTSGMVTTDGKFSFTYGYMEARIWLPGTGSVADWPAFWADGQVWPNDGEIDVVEGLSGLAQAHFHYSGGADGPLTGHGAFPGGWHTFAADWEPGSITYYYDGASIGTFTSGITASPMYLILDLATSAGNATPGTMKVQYVRVWQH
jgi:beta-glucanase (GH16 family)